MRRSRATGTWSIPSLYFSCVSCVRRRRSPRLHILVTGDAQRRRSMMTDRAGQAMFGLSVYVQYMKYEYCLQNDLCGTRRI